MKNKRKGSEIKRAGSSLPMLRKALKVVEKHFEGQTLDDAVPQIDNYFLKKRERIQDAINLIIELGGK